MRQLVTSFLIAGCVSSSALAFQARSGAPVARPAIRACAILTRDLVLPFAANPKVLELIPPEEETLGTYGEACEWGVVRLQIYPNNRSERKAPAKEWQVQTGVGEAAYFRNNPNGYAELMAWSGTTEITLQVSVPTGSTAEAMRPKAVALANAVFAKLR